MINVSPAELAELARIDGVVAVKQANNDDLQQIEGMDLLAGNDDGFMRTLELGGAGGILVAAHVIGPQMRQIWDAAQAGDLERARELDAGLRPVYDAMGLVTNPIPLKAALEMTGLIPHGGLRLPLVRARPEQRAIVREALDAVGVAVGG